MIREMETNTVKIQNRHSPGRDEPILRKAPSLFVNLNMIVSPSNLITESGSIRFLAANLVVWSQLIQNRETNNIKMILLIRRNIQYLLSKLLLLYILIVYIYFIYSQ